MWKTAENKKKRAYTRPCVGSAPVKNWNVEKKLPPWYESTREYGPAEEEDIDRVRRAANARSVMDRIKSSDSWNCTENQHIYVTPKEDENEPPPKGQESGDRENKLPPNGNADNSCDTAWELPSDVQSVWSGTWEEDLD